ncbi:hypothetical protein BDQ12DRAFT_737235 [Crucibulum laeve]|uniref:Uncharacterized protein n=1 Tax=Crucibulum laeve TaxID=68775 RepID=A0A5C3M4B1_9AGAR|nr:hypothetical protein BDQ12DRAFT_737235 [Crucibulum laeve]
MKLSLASTLLLTSAGISTVVSALPAVTSFDGRQLETTTRLQEREIFSTDVLEERDFYDDNILEARDFFDEDMLEARTFYYDDELQARGYEYELEERDFDELEARGAVGLAVDVAEGIVKIVNIIKGEVEKDKAKRSQFTQSLVQKFVKQYPHFNIVVCHTKHDKKFDGKEGVDWGHKHQEFDVKIGGTVGYEIYWFKGGWFDRKGDGGYLNWAYQGRIIKNERKGAKLTFAAP